MSAVVPKFTCRVCKKLLNLMYLSQLQNTVCIPCSNKELRVQISNTNARIAARKIGEERINLQKAKKQENLLEREKDLLNLEQSLPSIQVLLCFQQKIV